MSNKNMNLILEGLVTSRKLDESAKIDKSKIDKAYKEAKKHIENDPDIWAICYGVEHKSQNDKTKVGQIIIAYSGEDYRKQVKDYCKGEPERDFEFHTVYNREGTPEKEISESNTEGKFMDVSKEVKNSIKDLPDLITMYDIGARDIEKKGMSGYYIGVGYVHKGSSSSKKSEKIMTDLVYGDIKKAFKKFIESKGLDSDDIVIDNFINAMDSYRLYCVDSDKA